MANPNSDEDKDKQQTAETDSKKAAEQAAEVAETAKTAEQRQVATPTPLPKADSDDDEEEENEEEQQVPGQKKNKKPQSELSGWAKAMLESATMAEANTDTATLQDWGQSLKDKFASPKEDTADAEAVTTDGPDKVVEEAAADVAVETAKLGAEAAVLAVAPELALAGGGEAALAGAGTEMSALPSSPDPVSQFSSSASFKEFSSMQPAPGSGSSDKEEKEVEMTEMRTPGMGT